MVCKTIYVGSTPTAISPRYPIGISVALLVYNAPMNNYALLTLLRGNGDYMGLPEITFHYPPQVGREQELFTRAINTLQQYL